MTSDIDKSVGIDNGIGIGETVKGVIFNIQRFSIHDGPGIRTTVFFKGCSNRCFWCHNPEGLSPRIELCYYAGRCIGCGNCVAICPVQAHTIEEDRHVFHREKCVACGKCVDVCYSDALELSGRETTAKQAAAEAMEDIAFYRETGGGVTLSGGEPLMQKEFALEVLKQLKSGNIHTAVETSANCAWADLEELLPYIDLVMIDIKHTDPKEHKRVTGVSNRRILENAMNLMCTDKKVLFKVPIIPTVNDTDDVFKSIAQFVKQMADTRKQAIDIRKHATDANGAETAEAGIPELELIPFHKMARDKYLSLGHIYEVDDMESLTQESIKGLKDIAVSYGIRVKG